VLERTESFDSDQIARIDACLEKLLVNCKGVAALFADSAGQPFGHTGTLTEDDEIALATLAAGSLAATVAMARLLGHSGAFDQVFYEGRKHSVHSSAVGDGFLLVVAFDNRAKPGLVRIMAREAAKELLAVVEEAAENLMGESVRDLIDRQFGDALTGELDAIFPETDSDGR
jgi:predicted regulator of Ras-like GTPase activity (Roadblock/LC7/MglB family)